MWRVQQKYCNLYSVTTCIFFFFFFLIYLKRYCCWNSFWQKQSFYKNTSVRIFFNVHTAEIRLTICKNFVSVVKYALMTQSIFPLLHRQISSVGILWIKEKYTLQWTCKIKRNRKENNSVLHLMKGKLAKYLVAYFSS